MGAWFPAVTSVFGQLKRSFLFICMNAPIVYPAFRKSFPDALLSLTEDLFSALEPQLENGSLNFYVSPRPVGDLEKSYSLQLLFRNNRVVVSRSATRVSSSGLKKGPSVNCFNPNAPALNGVGSLTRLIQRSPKSASPTGHG